MLSIPTVVRLTTLLLVGGPQLCNAVLRQYNFTIHSGRNAPDGVSRPVYLINGQQPGPLIEVEEGDELEVFVTNNLPVENTIHWHGLLQHGTPEMDGPPGSRRLYPIPPGGNFTYRFSVGDQYGFYWYHSHFRAYYDDAIRGPLLIHPATNRSRPFEKLAGDNSADLANILQAENSATNILLNDWTHETSDTIYRRYIETGAFPFCVDSLIANGQGRLHEYDELDRHADLQLHGYGKYDGTRHVNADLYVVPNDLGDHDGLNASLKCNVFHVRCASYSSRLPLLTIPTNTTQSWLALNLVNSGSISDLSVSLDAHSLWVFAADGLYVTPQEVQVTYAVDAIFHVTLLTKGWLRLDQKPGDYYLRFASYPTGDMQQVIEGQAIVSYSGQNMTTTAMTMAPPIKEDPMSTWMFLNGSAMANATALDATSLEPFISIAPPIGAADVTKHFTINETGIVTWVMDGNPYTEPTVPILYGNTSDGWLANTTIQLPINSTIDIILKIAHDSMDMMGHPIHLHGHKFWILGSGTGDFSYASVLDVPQGVLNLHNPVYRDTADIPASGWLAIRFVTDNPGSGFALVFVEGANEIQGVVKATNSTNTPALPSSTTRNTGISRYNPANLQYFILLITAWTVLMTNC
ncbi:Cupredoxin [Penicillium chermesinum]|uniref:Cupredoxin n=1 Tax=Penicillium chermesinum TaxID=63820 RepID=A0A9W9P918_9EURO|nr:Cupredoxin [Penicillium chermesinum]KAJ5240047.1 Cupredoxin [Penicillium chermesinum]